MGALLAAGLTWILLGIPGGLRYPPLQYELDPAPAAVTSWRQHVEARGQGAFFQHEREGRLRFRALVPEPRITLTALAGAQVRLEIGNVHPAARLDAGGAGLVVHETREGLVRTVEATLPTGIELELAWRIPPADTYRFATIGDTGGWTELAWALERAAALGAQFVIHLGDLHYAPGEIHTSARIIEDSPVPVYVAIGNHEFGEGELDLVEDFVRYFGLRNYDFQLLDTRFVILDSAASTFPPSAGTRGRLLRSLPPVDTDEARFSEYVVITHRPLVDPRKGESHDIGGREAGWLRQQIDRLGARHLLAGHIHQSLEHRDGELHTWIAGEGLGHADLVAGRPVARILLGEVRADRPLRLWWEALEMPLGAHCSVKSAAVLRAVGNQALTRRVRQACGSRIVSADGGYRDPDDPGQAVGKLPAMAGRERRAAGQSGR